MTMPPHLAAMQRLFDQISEPAQPYYVCVDTTDTLKYLGPFQTEHEAIVAGDLECRELMDRYGPGSWKVYCCRRGDRIEHED